jgi:hypothetical protein
MPPRLRRISSRFFGDVVEIVATFVELLMRGAHETLHFATCDGKEHRILHDGERAAARRGTTLTANRT